MKLCPFPVFPSKALTQSRPAWMLIAGDVRNGREESSKAAPPAALSLFPLPSLLSLPSRSPAQIVPKNCTFSLYYPQQAAPPLTSGCSGPNIPPQALQLIRLYPIFQT